MRKKIPYTDINYLESKDWERWQHTIDYEGKKITFSFYYKGKVSNLQVNIGEVVLPFKPNK